MIFARIAIPLANNDVFYFIENGNFLLVNSGEESITKTDFSGSANIEFDRPFYSPLYILVGQEDKRTTAYFKVQPEEMSVDAIASQTTPEHYISGAEGDLIKLEMEIDSWSLL